MRFLVFVTPTDFHDETLRTVNMFFDKWGVEHQTASYSTRECRGSHGMVCRPGVNASKASVFGYDALLIVDGPGIDSYKMYDYRPLLDMVYSFNSNGKFVCAIGNAIKVVARSNIVKGKRISMPGDASVKSMVLLFHGIPTQSAVEAQGNVCTVGNPAGLEEAMPEMLSHVGIK